MKKLLLIILIFSGIFAGTLNAQVKGESAPVYNPDTVFIFKSPHKLVRNSIDEQGLNKALGFHLLLSENGYGFGMFYSLRISQEFKAFASLYISGARKSDEFEYYDPNTGRIVVPGKINRLYMLPLMFGVNYYLFHKVLDDGFQPYLSAGTGPSFILANPFKYTFFEALKYTRLYTRFGAFLGFGAEITSKPTAHLSIDIRYYHIPFGGEGIESVKDIPIKNFGGIFLSITFGWKF